MSANHPMLPDAVHDEAVEQLFVRDLKLYLAEEVEPAGRKIAEALDPGPRHNARVESVYEQLHEVEAFRAWASLRRTSQELLWAAIRDGIARQADELDARAAAAPPSGSLTLDPEFELPTYLAERDVHLMPGGYGLAGPGVFQGAVMDRGGAVYMLGRNGGFMNDMRGHSVVGHVFARFPDFEPERVIELGCGIGASLLPVAQAFPSAEVYGVDVGASMLSYAHARARHLGVPVHFVQGSAERTKFEDQSFDLVFSAALMHETSEEALPRILAESRRLLRPGGVAVHLEVPNRYDDLDLWGKIRGEIECDYNNEPAWKAAISADYKILMEQAGLAEVEVGYQASTAQPQRGNNGFSSKSQGTFRSWFVVSGRR